MSLPSVNFLHFTVSKILPNQEFIGQANQNKVKGKIKVTPTTPNLHLTFSNILPGQDFIGQDQYSKVKGHIKITP